MKNESKLDVSPTRRHTRWYTVPYLLVFLVAGGSLALFTELREAIASSDLTPRSEHMTIPVPTWTFPASINGAECLPAGIHNWTEEYEPPEHFQPPETYRERMIREIAAIWRMYLKDEHVKPEDKRWEKISIYATYLADAITIFQENTVTVSNVTGRLPRHYSTHRILASMVTLETALRSRIVGKGKLKEVGLIQCHGKALGGYHPNKVRRTPYLGLMLGARWLAVAIGECYPDGIDDQTWKITDWLGPLTVYGAGNGKGKNKNGVCRRFPIAHARVGLARMYGSRIQEMSKLQ